MGRGFESRRNHERCKQASLASHSERGGFCNIGSCGCLHTYNCLYYKRYSATQNLPMMPVYIRGSVRERRSRAKRLRQFRLSNYCRADAVKDERQRSQSHCKQDTRCVLFYFYIKPQLKTWTTSLCCCCVLFYFYIKPQLLWNNARARFGCVLFYFYIKPQHFAFKVHLF